MTDCPTRSRLAPRSPPPVLATLGELVAGIVAGLPRPAEDRPPRPPGPVTDDPLVRAVLASFPGSYIMRVREYPPNR